MKFFKKKTVTPLVIPENQPDNDVRPKSVQSKTSHHTIDVPTSSTKPSFRQQYCSKENLKEQALLIATVASVIIGAGVGIGLRGLKCPTGND